MVGEILLELKRAVEQVRRRTRNPKVPMEVFLELVIIASRARGVKLFQFPDRADEKRTSQLVELGTDGWMIGAGGGALVEYPAGYRHISSEASTDTSARDFSSCR